MINDLYIMEFLKNPCSRFYGSNEKDASDNANKIKYESNSLGYRGEDFNESAKLHIYVAGDSHAGGTGILNWEDTHSYIFKEIYADKNSIPIKDINLMNFSVGGCSESYLVRTLVSSCLVKKPDILICHFAHKKNKEFLGDEIEKFCPSWRDSDLLLLEHPLMGELNLFVDFLKEILLLQYFCQKNGIKYLFSWPETNTLNNFKKRLMDTHRYLFEEIDFSFFLDKHIRDIKIDYALDYNPNTKKGHAGPKSHKIYAQLIYDKYFELYG